MSMSNKVIWSEGMLLQPHHFQQQERYFENLIYRTSLDINPYHWGFSNLKIETEYLKMGKFSILECSGIFPDGTAFHCAEGENKPSAIEITNNIKDALIYLSLPHKSHNSQEISFSNAKQSDRYRVSSLEINDTIAKEESYSAQTSTIQTAKLHLQLIVAKCRPKHFTNLALVKIKEITSDQHIVLDDEFIPPCLNVYASSNLRKITTVLYETIKKRCTTLSEQILAKQINSSRELIQLNLLLVLSRYKSLLFNIINNQSKHPEQLYCILIQLFSELSVLVHHTISSETITAYEHNALHKTFSKINAEIEHLLSINLSHHAKSITLNLDKQGIWIGKILNNITFKKSKFILSISASSPIDKIKHEFPKQIKVGSHEQIRFLVSRALPGIDLQLLANCPNDLPYSKNCIYYLLKQDHPYWETIEKSGLIALHISNRTSGLNLKLWVVEGK